MNLAPLLPLWEKGLGDVDAQRLPLGWATLQNWDALERQKNLISFLGFKSRIHPIFDRQILAEVGDRVPKVGDPPKLLNTPQSGWIA
ncbi:hypothetical protein BST81_25635 [Leptolyngbya sp. 'hensonii']|nr:hypothetical protein BST81_25635 [Leptolyngbya sp. 'hensonii']